MSEPKRKDGVSRAVLTVTLVHDDKLPIYRRCADATLEAAKRVLTLLKELERSATGKRAKTVWCLNIYTLEDRTVLEFFGNPEDEGHRFLANETLRAVNRILGIATEAEL